MWGRAWTSRSAWKLLCLSVLLCGRAEGAARHPELRAVLPGGTAMEFVWIPPGSFRMGTTPEQEALLRKDGLWHGFFEEELPAHEVVISEGFWMGKYEVTQEQWTAVMGKAAAGRVHTTGGRTAQ